MTATDPYTLDFTPVRVTCLDEAFFAGAFAMRGGLDIRMESQKGTRVVGTETHWLVGSEWNTGGVIRSYVHRDPGRGASLGFKGYILGAGTIHSGAPSTDLFRYWLGSRGAQRIHNGVFSTARVSDAGRSLLLLSDCFGVSPLYFRQIGEVVLFATNPRFLATAADEPEWLARKNLLFTGIVPGDLTLTRGISRLPAGHALLASANGVVIEPWFNFDEFADGDRPVDSPALQEIENALGMAVRRCVSLPGYEVELPLSSGHDSRRVLAQLLRLGVDFSSSTVRVMQKGHRDLDAPIASKMARRFNFPHRIIELGDDEDYARLDLERQLLLDNESLMHTWAIRYMQDLSRMPTLLIDGVAGDILGNPGFRMASMYRSPGRDLELIVDKLFEKDLTAHLPTPPWPADGDLRNYVRGFLAPFMLRRNMPEFAFILLRQRRMTALWSHQLAPAGHLVVCPYLDLDYLRLMFMFHPQSKHDTVIQRACLERFQPQLAAYPGNRDIPPGLRAGDPSVAIRRDLACYRALRAECEQLDSEALPLLSGRARLLWRLSHYSDVVRAQLLWLHQPLTELLVRQRCRQPAWRFESDIVNRP